MEDRKRRVLLVEDNLEIRRLLTLELKGKGYDAFVAQDGQEALNQINTCTPDILLLDLNLPVINGLQVLSHLRKTSQIPVITISSRIDMGQESLELGADYFMPKPFDPEKLTEKIVELLK